MRVMSIPQKIFLEAIDAFEKLEALNHTEEYTFVDGLVCLAILYLEMKENRLQVLSRVIHILYNAGAFVQGISDWKNPGNNRVITQRAWIYFRNIKYRSH